MRRRGGTPRAATRQAFTAIEMVGVLFLASLMAGMTVVSLAGLYHGGALDDVLDHMALSNELVRQSAARQHAPDVLILHLEEDYIAQQMALSQGDSGERMLYRLPRGYHIARCVMAGGEDAFGTVAIPVSVGGLSPSFALQMTTPTKPCWIVVAGLTGQVTRVKDEQQVINILQGLAPAGHDAH